LAQSPRPVRSADEFNVTPLLLQPKIISIITSFCICSKSAANTLL